MTEGADARSAVSEEPLKLDGFHPSLRVMDWSDEPATDAQLGSLRRLGYQPLRPLTMRRAAHLICNPGSDGRLGPHREFQCSNLWEAVILELP